MAALASAVIQAAGAFVFGVAGARLLGVEHTGHAFDVGGNQDFHKDPFVASGKRTGRHRFVAACMAIAAGHVSARHSACTIACSVPVGRGLERGVEPRIVQQRTVGIGAAPCCGTV
jgi:hypothetical protein